MLLFGDEGTETRASGESAVGAGDPFGGAPSRVSRVRGQGLSVAHPRAWKRFRRPGLLTLESPGRCVAISFSAPAGARDSRRLARDSLAALQSSFGKVQVRREPPAVLGGRPTRSALVAVRRNDGSPVVVRQSVSRGRKLAHLSEVVFRAPPCAGDAPQVEAILGTIAFAK